MDLILILLLTIDKSNTWIMCQTYEIIYKLPPYNYYFQHDSLLEQVLPVRLVNPSKQAHSVAELVSLSQDVA